MHIFIDESGDLGFGKGATRNFVMVAVRIENMKRIGKMFKRIRKKLKKRVKSIPEFKWSGSSSKIKQTVLTELGKQDISVHYVLLKKSKVYDYLQDKKNIIYNYLSGFIVEELQKPDDEKIVVVIDKSLSKPNREEFNKYFQMRASAVFKSRGHAKVPVIEIRHVQSKDDCCLQVADFVAGAVFSNYEHGNAEYLDIISGKVRTRTEKW